MKDCNPLLKLAGIGPDEPERLELLIKANVDLLTFGRKALLLAVQNENLKIARKLLSAGVSITRDDMQAAIYAGSLHSSSYRFDTILEDLEEPTHFKVNRKDWLELLNLVKA